MSKIQIITILILLLLSACSPTTKTIQPGTYETTIAAADIPAEFPAEFALIMICEWNFLLKDNGAFAVSKDGQVVSGSKQEVAADQWVIRDEKSEMACIDPPDVAKGTYQYKYDRNGLELPTVQDHCGGRNLMMTRHPLSRK